MTEARDAEVLAPSASLEAGSLGSTALKAAEAPRFSGRNAPRAKSYPSARITRVSGWTPSCLIASAAGSVCMNS
jgi:hypothetical protein